MDFALEVAQQSLFDEMLPLLRLHYEEVAPYKDIPLEPNFENYLALQHSGMLLVYTARHEGALVGYAAFVACPSPHYASSVQATCDVVFVHPAYRGFGRRFIDWCTDQLADEGVQVVYLHVQAKHDFGKMLNKIGFELLELNYAKRLTRSAP